MSSSIDLFDRTDIALATQLFKEKNKIAIITHMSPDGDAIGSALGLGLWLKKYNTSNNLLVKIIVPNAFPEYFDWLPGIDNVCIYENSKQEVEAILENVDLLVFTDLNDPKRIGTLGTLAYENSCSKILIDHHPNPVSKIDIAFSYPAASSTCEIVYCLIKRIIKTDNAYLTLPLESATCLYTGIMTDTGNFSYNSNRPELYDIIAELVRLGVNKDQIFDNVHNQHSLARMRLIGYCLYVKMHLLVKNKISLIALNKDELVKFNFHSGDGEGIVNLPLQIKNVLYSCFMREDKIGVYDSPPSPECQTKIKISFRSRGNCPVNIFAKEVFSGGGHPNAAGGEFYGTLEDAVTLFKQKMNRYLK